MYEHWGKKLKSLSNMGLKQKLIQELSSFSWQCFKRSDHFMCVYGSYASEHHTKTSDIDIFVALEKYDVIDFEKVRDFLINLHIRYGLNLDDEVPYENKLVVSYEDIQHAIALHYFIKDGAQYVVPAVQKKKEFLSSPEIRWRLILNALTSPHECISGDRELYTTFRESAEKSITRLAHGLIKDKIKPTIKELVEALLSGPNKEEGEMYLGYKKERRVVIEYLERIIKKYSPRDVYDI